MHIAFRDIRGQGYGQQIQAIVTSYLTKNFPRREAKHYQPTSLNIV